MEATLDRFGRIVIPKRIRHDFGLRPGSVLHLEKTDHDIRLRPAADEPYVKDKNGVLVFSGDATGDLQDSVRIHREDRLQEMTKRKHR